MMVSSKRWRPFPGAIASAALALPAAAAHTWRQNRQRRRVSRTASALAGVLFGLVVGGVASGPALASPAWSIQPTPNPFLGGGVSSVSCPSAASCVGVGSYVNSDNRQEILAEQWNGTSWAIPPTANPSGVVDSSLTGVSCASANACTAVGNGLTSSDTDVALAGQWNGSGWAVQTVPSPAYSSLSGVSCTAGNACTVVGSSNISSTSSQTLALAWDGSSWTAQNTPNPSGATISALSGVSCMADGACTAVGYYINGSGADVTLSEQWTASTGWTIHLPANPGGATSSVLTGVSCTSGNACTAVGHSVSSSGVQQTLAEHWNGSSWTITLNTSGATNSSLSGVSCTADNACIAVGQTSGMTLAERWNPNGNSWTTLNTPALTNSALSGVSCTSGNACTTVGQASSGTLAERWDGTTFTIQTTTTPPLTGVLSSVSCATAAACSAVGHFNSENALAEQWDGTSWTIEPSPSWGASMYPVLSGVSCTAANACSAVGSMKHIYCPSSCNRGFKIVTGTMAMRFTGTGWSIGAHPQSLSGDTQQPIRRVLPIGQRLRRGRNAQAEGAWSRRGTGPAGPSRPPPRSAA